MFPRMSIPPGSAYPAIGESRIGWSRAAITGWDCGRPRDTPKRRGGMMKPTDPNMAPVGWLWLLGIPVALMIAAAAISGCAVLIDRLVRVAF